MASTFDSSDSQELTPEERLALAEVTTLLAVGVRRLLSLRADAIERPVENPSESSQNRLDESAQKRLHVPRS